MATSPKSRPAPPAPAAAVSAAARRRLITALMVATLGLIWLVIAVRFYVVPQPGTIPAHVWGILAAVSALNAAAHGFAAWFVHRRLRWGHVFAIMLVSANLVFTFTDQMGLADWIMLGLNVVALALLIWTGPTKPASD